MELLKDRRVMLMVAVFSGAMATACVFPSLDVTSWSLTTGLGTPPTEDPRLAHIAGLLKESRTGLNDTIELRLAEVILEESLKHDVDPLLVMALIRTESTFDNWAQSHKGALGLMQIMPETGRWVAGEFDIEWGGEGTLFDPYQNVRLGIRYYSVLRERYGNDTRLTLTAYNEGPTRLSRRIRRGRKPPRRYASKVLAHYRDFKESAVYN